MKVPERDLIAEFLGRAAEFGSIEVGKSADFIVIDQNLLKVPVTDIHKTKVLRTVLQGKTVWTNPMQQFFAAVLAGVTTGTPTLLASTPGSGKSHAVHAIARLLQVPCHEVRSEPPLKLTGLGRLSRISSFLMSPRSTPVMLRPL